MEDTSKETRVLTHIQELVAEEHRLYDKKALDDAETRRLEALQVELDQCWDLLRQRDARREFGENPEEATLRSEDVVEKYLG
jgi:Protein of unknown function (DUF2630)